MNARTLAILSVAFNVVLAAGLWRTSRSTEGASTPEISASPRPEAQAVRVRTNVTQVEVTLTNERPAFRWEQVQSEDLTNYVAGLRRIGCPNETIRDIIRGELAGQYLERRRVVLDPWQRRYWDLAVHGFSEARDAYGKELAPVRKQTLERLDGLMGGPGSNPEESEPPEPPVSGSPLDFLSEEKQRQVTALQEKYTRSMEDSSQQYPMKAEQRAKLKELKEQRLEAVRAVLTPEEFEEYRLRTSGYASAGRRLGFDATEDELRAVTRTYDQFSAADEPTDRKSPDYEATRKRQQELKQQRDEALKATLGEERFAEFKRAQNGGFERILEVTERYGLSRETAIASFDIRTTAQANVAQVRGNRALTEEQRRELLQSIQRETRAQLDQTLGERASRTYEKHGGAWLEQIGR